MDPEAVPRQGPRNKSSQLVWSFLCFWRAGKFGSDFRVSSFPSSPTSFHPCPYFLSILLPPSRKAEAGIATRQSWATTSQVHPIWPCHRAGPRTSVPPVAPTIITLLPVAAPTTSRSLPNRNARSRSPRHSSMVRMAGSGSRQIETMSSISTGVQTQRVVAAKGGSRCREGDGGEGKAGEGAG